MKTLKMKSLSLLSLLIIFSIAGVSCAKRSEKKQLKFNFKMTNSLSAFDIFDGGALLFIHYEYDRRKQSKAFEITQEEIDIEVDQGYDIDIYFLAWELPGHKGNMYCDAITNFKLDSENVEIVIEPLIEKCQHPNFGTQLDHRNDPYYSSPRTPSGFRNADGYSFSKL